MSCPRSEAPRARFEPQLAQRVLLTYADIAHASYSDALQGARRLLAAIDELLLHPSEVTLAATRAAWRAARAPYVQSEVFRFYDGPIDRVELLLNTWPIDENYVEGTPDGREPGVIDDPARYPTLDRALLVSLNAREGETRISTGYHVIEFLLWGRDTNADGPGTRAATDFVERGEDNIAARRRHYLQLAGQLLVEHLQQVEQDWRAGVSGNYRASFLALAPGAALGLALRGMGSLSGPELAGERLTVPYETRDQENEHSCFSDTTQQDIANDVRGCENVWLGRYRRSDGNYVRGSGLRALVAGIDSELEATLSTQIAASLAAAQSIPAPFDQALIGDDQAPGRTAIKRTIRALEAQTTSLARAAALLGIGATSAPSVP